MSDPTETLEKEHRVIARVVSLTPVLAERIELGQTVGADILRGIAEFMRIFADKCHHGKEEDWLFRILAAKGVPVRGCPIGALTAEHGAGRAFVQGLAEATDALEENEASAREALVKNLRGIAHLYPNHIWKEDYLLFPMTHKVLEPEELQALSREFEKVDNSIGQDVIHRLTEWAEGLEAGL